VAGAAVVAGAVVVDAESLSSSPHAAASNAKASNAMDTLDINFMFSPSGAAHRVRRPK
jgi:hypothetical protein